MFNYIQTDDTFCYVKIYPHFISNEEIFAYAFYIGYLLSSNHDYRGMNRLALNFISLEINASYNYTDFCTKCGDVYPHFYYKSKCSGSSELVSIDIVYIFTRQSKTIFQVHQKIRD